MGKTALVNFVKFLEGKDLIQLRMIRDGDAQFSNRFRIQKYAFLAQRLGLGLPYEYDIHLYGPYSTQLASDCSDLARNRADYEQADGRLDDAFDTDRFLHATRDKPRAWLETAATLIDTRPYCADRDQLLKQVESMRDEPEPGYVSRVLCELEELRLV